MLEQKTPQNKSTDYAFFFYSGALLIWSLYDLFINDKIGVQMPILFIGLSLFLWTKVYYHQKKIKESLISKNREKQV